jgi:hypothetical protein
VKLSLPVSIRPISLLFISILIIPLFLASTAHASWTVMNYFVPDEKIESGLLSNVNQMARVGSSDKLKIVVQFDYAKKPAVRYFITNGGAKAVEQLGEVNMGDPQTLYDFIKWTMKNYPADNYFLIINSHGSGWESYEGPGALGSTPGSDNVNLKRGVPVDLLTGAPDTRSIGYDDDPGDCLTLGEIRQVLDASKALNNGKNINIIAADACLFSMVECICELADCVNIVESSSSTMPGSGLAYGGFLSALSKNPGMSENELARVVAKTFIDIASGDNVLAAVNAKAAEKAMGDLDELVKKIAATGTKPKVSNLVKYDDQNKYWDLLTIARSIKAGDTSLAKDPKFAEIKTAAAALDKSLSDAIVSEWYSGSFATSKVGGIAIYWPDTARYEKYRPYYKKLLFAKTHMWDEFLDYHLLNQAFGQSRESLVRDLERLYGSASVGAGSPGLSSQGATNMFSDVQVTRSASTKLTALADERSKLEKTIVMNALSAHKSGHPDAVRGTLEEIRNSTIIPAAAKKQLMNEIVRAVRVQSE